VSCVLVVIDRLPFTRPDDPLEQARRDAVVRRGGDGFLEVDLPATALALAQGAGRLVRSHDDRGVVAVLDRRLATARYRTVLLEALPPFRRVVDREVARDFLARASSDCRRYARPVVAVAAPERGAREQTLRERVVDLANRVGERFIRWLDGYFGRHSLVGNHTFFDPDDFAWVAELEAGAPAIRAELDEVLSYSDELPNFQDISTDQYQITDEDRWKTFFFYGYGFTAGSNVERCPQTDRLLRQIPGMTTAMFSIFAPHKRVPAHGGPYKGVLRYHLALKVPEPRDACGIRVGNDVRHWTEGKSLVFDDVYEHEAWNDTDGTRVVLFVDFKRPLAGFPRLLNDVIIKVIGWSPFVQDAKARHNAWEKRFEQVRERAA
jgi:beta-hydroxylase